MSEKEWALICSFIAMLLIASSYFFKSKGMFLLMQGLGIVGLMASYLLNGQYFAMIGLGVGLVRCIVFFLYEKKGRETPLLWCILFSVLSVGAYLVVNLWILQTANPEDIIYLICLILYVFIFRVRSIKFVRYASLAPTTLSMVYNVLARSPIFAVISYSFELAAGLVSILKYHVFGKEQESKE